jgi:hypothetical protein
MIEGWVNWDALGMMQQQGIVAELGKAKATSARQDNRLHSTDKREAQFRKLGFLFFLSPSAT